MSAYRKNSNYGFFKVHHIFNMIITPEFKLQVQTAFDTMQSKSDFLVLLNIAKQIMYGNKTVPFSEKQLNYFITKANLFY